MSTLWLKFPDEAIFTTAFTDSDKKSLEEVFATTQNSPFMRALRLAGLTPPAPATPMLQWYNDLPYFNWSALTGILSAGTIYPVKTSQNSYTFRHTYTLKNLLGLMRGYWNMTRYLSRPFTDNDLLAQSIALGFIMQSLVLRLGADVKSMPAWLASPGTCPKKYTDIINGIQRIQLRRTAISKIWSTVFNSSDMQPDNPINAPDHFWDDDVTIQQTINLEDNKGIGVCAGTVTGLAILVDDIRDLNRLTKLKSEKKAPLILVFRYARPNTTEVFKYADGLIFCEGGVLSHACTIAREYNIPAITQVGQNFPARLETSGTWVTIDGATSSIIFL